MSKSSSFANFVHDVRERKKNEALAQEFLGRGRKGPTAGAGSLARPRETSEKPSLLSRISGGGGVQKRSSSARPTGNIDGKWQHDLHKVNNPRGPAAQGRALSRTASASQVDRNSRTYNKFASVLNKNAGPASRTNDAPGFSIRGVATGGPCTVVATNFAPGTTAADIEAVLTPVGGETLSCRLISAAPTVMVELQFVSRDGAENVIATFNNQKADGRVLYVYMKEPTTSNAVLHSRPAHTRSPRLTQAFGDDMDIDTNAGARGGTFQDGRHGFGEGGRRDPPRGPRRRF